MERARLMYAAPAKDSNILWASGFYAPDSFSCAVYQGKTYAVTSDLEYGRMKKESRVDEILSFSDLEKKYGEEQIKQTGGVILFLKELGVAAVAVAAELPAKLYLNLITNGIGVEFQDPLFPERAVKSEDELKDIRYAQESMEAAFNKILGYLEGSEIRDGKLWYERGWQTSERLRSVFEVETTVRGCVCDATIIASGNQAADPHSLGFGPILANTPIVCDMFPRSKHRWYWSDMTRTVVKGKLSDEARQMYWAVYDAQQYGIEKVTPGADGAEIHNGVAKILHDAGFRTEKINGKPQGFIHSTGHGVGLDIHEPPWVANTPPGLMVLRPGNVITIEPGLYYDGIGGVRIESIVLVTEYGCEPLDSAVPKTLLEIP